MSDLSRHTIDIPRQQQAIRNRCFHPSGNFIEFRKEDIEQSIPDRFEEQVRKYPDQLAVKTRNQQMTYDELNKAANRLARAIEARQELGRRTIALLLEHGTSFITGMMAGLKAARIVVPLDSSYPHARIASSLEDSQAGLIVTDSQNFSLAGELAGHEIPLPRRVSGHHSAWAASLPARTSPPVHTAAQSTRV